MTLWGNTDVAGSSPLHAPAQFSKAPTRTNANLLFGNTTISAMVTGQTVGIFGVDTTEIAVSNGSIVAMQITNNGTGYTANAVVTVGGNGTANGLANSIGRISTVNITAAGNSYAVAPPVSIAAPAAITFNALTAVSNTADTITLVGHTYQAGDLTTYLVAVGNTAVIPLANNTQYRVAFANSTVITIANNVTGANVDLTATVTETGHSFTGVTATAQAVISSSRSHATHAGWVVRTVGTGGRAGRVTYETLVAMGMTSGTDAEDTIFKDV